MMNVSQDIKDLSEGLESHIESTKPYQAMIHVG